MKPAVALAVLAVAAVALSGCAGEDAPDLPDGWRGRDLRQPGWTNVTIEPQWTYALEYHWAGGTRVSWDWYTTPEQYLYFRLVRMEGEQQHELFGRHAREDKGSATVPASGAHQMLWINDFVQPITLTVRPPEGALARSYPPGEGPGCLLLVC